MAAATRICDVPSTAGNHGRQSIEDGRAQVDGRTGLGVDGPGKVDGSGKQAWVEGPIDEDAVREVLIGLEVEVEGRVV